MVTQFCGQNCLLTIVNSVMTYEPQLTEKSLSNQAAFLLVNTVNLRDKLEPIAQSAWENILPSYNFRSHGFLLQRLDFACENLLHLQLHFSIGLILTRLHYDAPKICLIDFNLVIQYQEFLQLKSLVLFHQTKCLLLKHAIP